MAGIFFSLDRIEDDVAVLIDDTGDGITISLSVLPDGACEGMVYRKVGDVYVRDLAEEEIRRERVRALHNRLRK